MAYIGKQPVVGNFVKLDAIVTSATTTFNLLNGGVAYFPQSANNCIVSLNGIIQEPTSSGNVGGYTISGSTIVFTSALTTLDVIDFILVLGDTLSIGTPSDGTVSFAKVTSNLITGATAETSIAGGDSVLIYDDSASALRKMTRTNFVAGIGATAGQVIQVVSTTKQDVFSASIASGTFTDVTGLSVSITPSSASNKILIMCHVVGALDTDENRQFIMIKRDGSQLLGASGTASGSRISTITIQGAATTAGGATHFFNFLDSPSSTSSLTYQISMTQGSGTTKTIYVNRGSDDDNQSYIGRAASTITVMEIKG
jgi:hypothetical protein